MSKACYQLTVTDSAGNAKGGASVRVTIAGTNTLVPLYLTRAGTGNPGNPFNADTEGFAQFFVDQGTYDVRVTYAGNVRTHAYVPMFETTNSGLPLPSYILDTPDAGANTDYTPPLFTTSTTDLDLDPGAGDATIGGLPPGGDGQEVTVTNVNASNQVTILKEDVLSTAAWRFQVPYDMGMVPGQSFKIRYIAAVGRWRVV